MLLLLEAAFTMWTLDLGLWIAKLLSNPPGEHLTDDYKRNINRFGKIPCINDNGFLLAETPAILQYLMLKYEATTPEHWYPRDIKTRARVDEYLSWQHINTRMNSTLYFWLQWVVPLRTGKKVNDKKLAEAKTQMVQTLDFIDKEYLKSGRFIAGTDQISIADLLAVSELQQLRKCLFYAY